MVHRTVMMSWRRRWGEKPLHDQLLKCSIGKEAQSFYPKPGTISTRLIATDISFTQLLQWIFMMLLLDCGILVMMVYHTCASCFIEDIIYNKFLRRLQCKIWQRESVEGGECGGGKGNGKNTQLNQIISRVPKASWERFQRRREKKYSVHGEGSRETETVAPVQIYWQNKQALENYCIKTIFLGLHPSKSFNRSPAFSRQSIAFIKAKSQHNTHKNKPYIYIYKPKTRFQLHMLKWIHTRTCTPAGHDSL